MQHRVVPYLVLFCFYGLCGCAYYGRPFHSFELQEDPRIEYLDFQYGSVRVTGIAADKGDLETGHIPQGQHTSGRLPVGDVLYVKWMVLATGKIYSDTVNLKDILPYSMSKKILYAVASNAQLYVYIIEGLDVAYKHDTDKPDCPVKLYKDLKCSLLYPNHWANF